MAGAGAGFNAGGMFQAIAGEIPVITTLYTGLRQGAEARRLEKRFKRPKMKTPDAAIQNNLMARNMAGTYGLPGQGKLQNQLDADVAQYLSNIEVSQQSPAAQAAAALAMEKNKMAQDAKLGIEAARNQQANLNNLYNQNSVLAGYQMANWTYNERMPYEQAMEAARMLKNASIQNTNMAAKMHSDNDKDFFASQGGGAMMGGGGGGAGKDGGGGGGAINTGFSQSPGWGGMGQSVEQQQPWGGMGQKPQTGMNQEFNFDTDAIMNYRIKTGDYTSSEFEIMNKLYSNPNTPYRSQSGAPWS